MFNHYIDAFKKYAIFSGRSTRSEFWYFVLANFLIQLIIGIIEAVIGGLTGAPSTGKVGLMGTIYSFLVLVPSIAIAARRLHDAGLTGWFMLIPIYNIFLYCRESDPGDNQYGPNPHNALIENYQ
jgi:uncharacterized membrane protein YhaH (DUF805 family)